MNCQEAIERLPWWLNGTLDPAERRQVEDHLATCPSCRTALEQNRMAWEIFAQHIPTETLVAYAYGELPESLAGDLDASFLATHLAECPQCAAELELVHASRRLEEADGVALFPARPTLTAPAPRRERFWQTAALAAGLAGLVAAGGWMWSFANARDLSRQLTTARATAPAGADSTTATTATPAKTDETGKTLARLREIESENRRLAETLQRMEERVKAAQGQVAQVQKAPAVLPQAWGNTAVVDASSDVLRGEPAAASTLVTFGPGELATLLLHPKPTGGGAGPAAGDHVLEMTDAGGRRLWRLQHVRPDRDSSYTVTFTRQPPGEYTIELDPGTAAAERFPISVR